MIVDETVVNWSADQWRTFGAGMAVHQFVLVSDQQGVRVYTRGVGLGARPGLGQLRPQPVRSGVEVVGARVLVGVLEVQV